MFVMIILHIGNKENTLATCDNENEKEIYIDLSEMKDSHNIITVRVLFWFSRL